MAILQGLDLYALDASLFTFSGGTFIAEASDLKGYEVARQIYDDACDVGFAIRNHATGNVVRFYMEQPHTDREGDITHWTFKVIPEDARKDPRIAKLSVKIFND